MHQIAVKFFAPEADQNAHQEPCAMLLPLLVPVSIAIKGEGWNAMPCTC